MNDYNHSGRGCSPSVDFHRNVQFVGGVRTCDTACRDEACGVDPGVLCGRVSDAVQALACGIDASRMDVREICMVSYLAGLELGGRTVVSAIGERLSGREGRAIARDGSGALMVVEQVGGEWFAAMSMLAHPSLFMKGGGCDGAQ